MWYHWRMDSGETIQINLRLDRASLDRLDALNPGTNRSAFIRRLVGQAVGATAAGVDHAVPEPDYGAELLQARANGRSDTIHELASVLEEAKRVLDAGYVRLARA
jgi:hypothetical protein